jgi:hypothetical protein
MFFGKGNGLKSQIVYCCCFPYFCAPLIIADNYKLNYKRFVTKYNLCANPGGKY